MYNNQNKTQGVFIMTKQANPNGVRKKAKTESLGKKENVYPITYNEIPIAKEEDKDLENMEQLTEYWIKIVLDEEKILREQEYSLEKMYKAIDDIALKSNMKKINKYYYISKDNTPIDLGVFVICKLKEFNWFMSNARDLILYENGEEPDDMIKFFEEKKKIKKYA